MDQIKTGGPVTVTDPRMKRYFMTIAEACSLVLKTGGIGKNGFSYLLDMGEPIRVMDIAEQLIRSSAIDILVVDSVAALTPKSEIEGEMGDRSMGLQARLMSQAMRKLTGTISRTNTTCIFINQLREKIGVMFGPAETTTGGNALKFYASVRIDIRSSTPIKDGEDVLGRHTKVKVVKNKVAPPFRRAEFDIMFGEGISKSGEIIDLGVQYDIITKSGSWFSYNGTRLAQGRDAAKRVIADNPELADELEEKIMRAMKGEPIEAEAPQTKAPKAKKDDIDMDFDTSLPDDFSIEEDL